MVWGDGKTDSSIWLDIYLLPIKKKSFLDLKMKHKAMKKCLNISSGLVEELMLLKQVLYLII